ncbi:chitin deacetylase 8 [Pieris napi]|uniref:chitin deacetylase 8 n=1 Tax=Pieris napi TaxID=78633 RepID=UPI001FB8BD30|nr:chitin deacetylase 8 [Pieris napi]
MRLLVIFACVIAALAQELPLAEECDAAKCKLPDCRCSGTDIPGGFEPHRIPQFVLLTFDDAVTVGNIETYRSLLVGRRNFNKCQIGTTFFVSHEYTDYRLLNELYSNGFEIALHSISHQSQDYFRNADKELLRKEFADQKTIITNFGAIPADSIQGIRMPFLQMAGNVSFEVMKEAGLRYDLSMPTTQFDYPGMWPYTLDYASTQDCISGPCPTASLPGLWAIPMVAWTDLAQFKCAMVDACFSSPADDDTEGWFRFIVQNFERHYLGNRAPFGFYVHEGPVRTRPGLRAALVRFLDMLSTINDVALVTPSELLDWVQNPVSLSDYLQKPCREVTLGRRCRPVTCVGLSSNHTQELLNLNNCLRCPRVYPWLGNPLGE